MKTIKSLYILVILCLIQTNLNAQWTNIYTYDKEYLLAIECLNEDTVFVAGNYSTIIRTYDKGETWQAIDPGFEIHVMDINFPDEQTGYIVGNNGRIAKTMNYGDTWELMITDPIFRLEKAEFIDPDTGWIIGTKIGSLNGIILKTTNGGMIWEYFYPDTDIQLFDIEMLNSMNGFISIDIDWSAAFGFLKTEDGGSTWNLSNPELAWTSSVSFINDNIGYFTAFDAGLYKTTNGGITWDFITNSYEIGFHEHHQLLFLTEQIGFYVGWEGMFDNGKISRTDDGGYTWTDQIIDKFWDIDMLDIDTGYAVTYNGEIYKTTNGGILEGISELNIGHPKFTTISPNPLTDKSIIKIDQGIMDRYKRLSFLLYDQLGRRIKTINIVKDEFEISREYFSPGIYFYLLTTDNKIIESNRIWMK